MRNRFLAARLVFGLRHVRRGVRRLSRWGSVGSVSAGGFGSARLGGGLGPLPRWRPRPAGRSRGRRAAAGSRWGASIITMLRPSRLGRLSMAPRSFTSSASRMKDRLTAFRVNELPAAEHDGDLDLVLVLEEPHHVALLGGVVVRVDLRAELDLLDGDRALVLAGLLRLLLLLVAPLAVVHDPADRRTGVRRHLDQVEVRGDRDVLGLGQLHDAPILTVGVDQAHLIRADRVVDPRGRPRGRPVVWTAPRRQASPCGASAATSRARAGDPVVGCVRGVCASGYGHNSGPAGTTGGCEDSSGATPGQSALPARRDEALRCFR